MTLDLPALLADTVDVVHAAGDLIRRHDAPVPIHDPTMKGLRDPVTEVDLASERLLVELEKLRPAPIIAVRDDVYDELAFEMKTIHAPRDGVEGIFEPLLTWCKMEGYHDDAPREPKRASTILREIRARAVAS